MMKHILRVIVSRYGNRTTIHVAAGTVLIVILLGGIALFATSGSEGTIFGVHLGADFGQFYSASVILDRYGTERIYDFALQDSVLHELVPGVEKGKSLPFVYPPFLLPFLRPLSIAPYHWAYFAFLVAMVAGYAISISIAIQAGNTPIRDRMTIWLMALSFTPFAMESCLGGQLSPIGAMFISLAIACDRWNKPFLAGLVLACLFYKPTLPALLIVVLIAGQRWRICFGVSIGVLVLAAMSITIIGRDGAIAYIRMLIDYGQLREMMSEIFSGSKYVDLPSYLTTFGIPRTQSRIIAAILAVPMTALLAYVWFRTRHADPVARILPWAATVCWLLLVTQYGPIYDVSLIVPALTMADGAVPSFRERYRWVVAGVYLAALFGQPAALVGINIVSPALLVAGGYLCRASMDATFVSQRCEGSDVDCSMSDEPRTTEL